MSGDTCHGGAEYRYEPYMLSCPVGGQYLYCSILSCNYVILNTNKRCQVNFSVIVS